MGSSTLLIAEKVIKVIAAYLLGEDKYINSNDIASLCSSFFKSSDSILQLQLNTSLQQAQLELSKGIELILSKSSLTEQQQSMLKESIINSVNNTDLSSTHLAKLRNDPNRLSCELINNCVDLKTLSQNEEEYVKRCLKYLSAEIISIISRYSSDFSARNYQEILQEIDKINEYLSQNMKETIRALYQESDPISDFYSEYKLAIKRNHSYVELFSSKIDEGFARSYQLDLAYIELFLKLHDSHGDQSLSIQQLLSRGKRWLIIGEAGCGKTTLLKWLAYSLTSNSPKDNNLEILNGFFPVIITLRKINRWDKFGLRQAIKIELGDSGVNIPQKFLNSLRNGGGKLLLLIDGLDEIGEEKRANLYKWLFTLNNERDEWVKKENEHRLSNLRERTNEKAAQLSDREKAKNELIILLTSRPILSSAAISNLSDDMKFQTAYVQPMTHMDVQRFIDYWHTAISYGRYFKEEMLLEKARKLKSRIGSQESMSRLAQNPLLCAMICALHFKKDGILPANKLELYDSCAQMLLEERDVLRAVDTGKYKNLLELEYEDKRRILSDLALWMLDCNGALLMDYASAAKRLKAKISFMQKISKLSDEDAETQAKLILTYFIERGGILRWIDNGKIGFIHKTFQEYFAAYQIYLGEEWNKIISPQRATDAIWRETIILSVSFSSRNSAEKVINSFLCRSNDRNSKKISAEKDHKTQIVYRLLAINCAATARELEPHTKEEIDTCTKALIPPGSVEIGKALSSCGNLVVPLLAYNPSLSERDLLACAKVLIDIGTRQSLAQLIEYLDNKIKEVYNALSLHWRYLTAEAITESGIVPAYIEAIFIHSIKNEQKKVVLDKYVINQLSRIAAFCSYRFSKVQNTYVLSDTMKKRLSRRMSRVEVLNISNYQFFEQRQNEAILKILDLFSISTSITTISVSYEYGQEEIFTFRSIMSQFKSLTHLIVYDVPYDIAKELEEELSPLNIKCLEIRKRKPSSEKKS